MRSHLNCATGRDINMCRWEDVNKKPPKYFNCFGVFQLNNATRFNLEASKQGRDKHDVPYKVSCGSPNMSPCVKDIEASVGITLKMSCRSAWFLQVSSSSNQWCPAYPSCMEWNSLTPLKIGSQITMTYSISKISFYVVALQSLHKIYCKMKHWV